jgi:hypothetical protein
MRDEGEVVTEEIVGAVRSIVMMVAEVDAAAGPTELPVTEFAFNRGIKVPSLQEEIDIVKLVPELADTEKLHPVEVPEFSKSPLSSPDIDSFMLSEYVIALEVLVGEICELENVVTEVDG